jgi:hypothetical protein
VESLNLSGQCSWESEILMIHGKVIWWVNNK